MIQRTKKIYITVSLIALFCAHTLWPTAPASYIYAYDSAFSSTPPIHIFNGSSYSSLDTLTSSFQVGTGAGQQALAITPNGRYMYRTILSFQGSFLDVIDLTNNNSVTQISNTSPITSNFGLKSTPDGHYLYCANHQGVIGAGNSYLVVVDTTTQSVVGTPLLVSGINFESRNTLSPNNSLIAISPTYPTSNTGFAVGNTQIVIPFTINTGTGAPTLGSSFTVGPAGGENLSVAFSPDGSILYVLNYDYGLITLYPVNPSTHAVGPAITSFSVTPPVGHPEDYGHNPLLITPDGKQAYILLAGDNIHAVHLSTGVTTAIPGTAIAQGAFSSDGLYLYVVQFNGSSIQVISTATNTVVYTISSPSCAYNIAVGSKLDGQQDTTFGNNGVTLTPISRADTLQNAALETTDNKIITAGGTFANNTSSLFLARYTANGALDTSFNSTNGYQTLLLPSALACVGNAVALDASNNSLVAGYSAQNPTSMVLARYTSAGALDTTFPGGSGPGYTTLSIGQGVTANGVGVQSTGQIIVGGTCTLKGIPQFMLARFNSDGTLDTTFGPNGTGYTLGMFGNISILKGIGLLVNSAGVYTDWIIACGAVDNQIFIATYDNNGNLIQTLAPGIGSSSIGYSAIWDPNPGLYTSVPYTATYIAGSATVNGIMQPLLAAYDVSSNVLIPLFNQTGTPGYVVQSIPRGGEYYSVNLTESGNILCSGYAVGNLANQLMVMEYTGVLFDESGSGGNDWGYSNYYFNNSNGPVLTTIGNNTAGQTLLYQQSSLAPSIAPIARIVTAGTSDGIFCLAGFYGE
jgi:uncharacterized delta-60 repeat protein